MVFNVTFNNISAISWRNNSNNNKVYIIYTMYMCSVKYSCVPTLSCTSKEIVSISIFSLLHM